ncbi:polynucleotide kinase-phosphatase [Deinococcus roseus]|uniref:Polynucleotide kinase-phosphatase n=1 Tax=Deinococcus roseus TaxID=392414 RepID=A0ABQ2CTF6_9DEIO|nr:polynucleotide kinase-phosphatase [Deinococcus roseus]GGJ19260.1 polynucleotide kinase-phosphatase [Deinococcus roseus]
MNIQIPELCLVALIGASSSGKSTFAKQHFKPTEILSSDYFRALLTDDENNLEITREAFELLHHVARKRLLAGKLTVIDATSLQKDARAQILRTAKETDVLTVALVLDIPEETLMERHHARPDREFPVSVIRKHAYQLKNSLRSLEKEGFRQIHVLKPEDLQTLTLERKPLYNNLKHLTGPFDFVGDVHGCFAELRELLIKLGYVVTEDLQAHHPEGRTAVFVGDLVDRGPDSVGVLRLVMNMVKAGTALCVMGNHDEKLKKHLSGKRVQVRHGLEQTAEQLAATSHEFHQEVSRFLEGLISHYVLDQGNLVVAHAGLIERYHGRTSARVREFCLYGETTGESDEEGLPIRLDWAKDYRGKARVIYGHVPVQKAQWVNNTIDLDTGCVFGGKLTALQYPELTLAEVAAHKEYCEPGTKLKNLLNAQQAADHTLRWQDFAREKFIETAVGTVRIHEANNIAALETASRFALDPRWLIFLPPTVSPSHTSERPDLLEHPEDAFRYYQKQGLSQVVCEEKHMGSRAIAVVCRNSDVARTRFGMTTESLGVVYSRTGRAFFNDEQIEKALLERLSAALERAGFWEEFQTNWVCLDGELLPWSFKALSLLKEQYASTGSAATHALQTAVQLLQKHPDATAVLQNAQERLSNLTDYVQAYQNYCQKVDSLEDLKFAPFHLLATEGQVHSDKTHLWHMETLERLSTFDPLLAATPYQVVDLHSEESIQQGIQWWETLTRSGKEGMVVKPMQFVPDRRTQPALKIRGREYLRIIYGPEYTQHLDRLRGRALGAKRERATREFHLGLEALNRFVTHQPLWKIHECILGVLALETEGIDPRL